MKKLRVNSRLLAAVTAAGCLCSNTLAADALTLDLPMPGRLVKGRQRQAGRAAVMRGPQAFSLDPARNAELAKLDATDPGHLALNPKSLGAPARSDAARPGGLACRVSVWKPGFGLGDQADYELTLTEFPDPEGKATYFRPRDFSGPWTTSC